MRPPPGTLALPLPLLILIILTLTLLLAPTALARMVELCHPHMLDGLRTPVPVRKWGEESAEGKCMGCRCRQKNGTKKKK